MFSSFLSSFSPTAAIEDFFKTHGHSRVAKLRFMQSPWEVTFLAIFYVYFSYDLGPKRLMRGRAAFDLVWTVRIFNTLILFLNVWILSRFFSLLNYGYDSLGCAPVQPDDSSPEAEDHIRVCHIFLYSRILELIDTLWIILRKKNRQITFLHVFHHSFVLLMTWFYFKLAPGGSSAMFPIVNGLVHTVMYAYYILSTFESIKPYLWWKRYVTKMQLCQFIVLGVHFFVAAATPNCKYPRALSLFGLAIAMMFFTLFIAFYKETYTQPANNKLNKTPASKKSNTRESAQTEPDLEKLSLGSKSSKRNDSNNNYNYCYQNNNNNNNNENQKLIPDAKKDR